jgi:hydroxypyruvate isomerase
MVHATAVSRRKIMKRIAACLGASELLSRTSLAQAPVPGPGGVQKGRLSQSAARWCYNKIPFEELAKAGAEIGLKGIDLVNNLEDWPVLKKFGLVCTMTAGGGTIADGLNRKENHDRLEREFRENIPRAAAAGWPNVITFSGNRRGLSDQEGLENTVVGLNRVKALAEEHKVTICLELLNSKVDHKDYQCDHAVWGLEVIKRVNSPRVKLLYDIYHAQIMDGDIIRTIRQNIESIAHFHTGGVPGRHELDDTQELNWRTIARAIADTGFSGYIAHEFVPVRDPLTSLREAVAIFEV